VSDVRPSRQDRDNPAAWITAAVRILRIGKAAAGSGGLASGFFWQPLAGYVLKDDCGNIRDTTKSADGLKYLQPIWGALAL
jgi:hypothetical protein